MKSVRWVIVTFCIAISCEVLGYFICDVLSIVGCVLMVAFLGSALGCITQGK